MASDFYPEKNEIIIILYIYIYIYIYISSILLTFSKQDENVYKKINDVLIIQLCEFC